MGDIGDKRFCVVTLFLQRPRFCLQLMSQFEEGVGEGLAKNRLPAFLVHKGRIVVRKIIFQYFMQTPFLLSPAFIKEKETERDEEEINEEDDSQKGKEGQESGMVVRDIGHQHVFPVSVFGKDRKSPVQIAVICVLHGGDQCLFRLGVFGENCARDIPVLFLFQCILRV